MSAIGTTIASVAKNSSCVPPVSAVLWKTGLVSCGTIKVSGAATSIPMGTGGDASAEAVRTIWLILFLPLP